jgi:hypothetical protein
MKSWVKEVTVHRSTKPYFSGDGTPDESPVLVFVTDGDPSQDYVFRLTDKQVGDMVVALAKAWRPGGVGHEADNG